MTFIPLTKKDGDFENWFIEKIVFNVDISCLIVLSSEMVLGYALVEKMTEDRILVFCEEIVQAGFKAPKIIQSDFRDQLISFCSEHSCTLEASSKKNVVSAIEKSCVKFILKDCKTMSKYKVWRATWPQKFKYKRNQHNSKQFCSFVLESEFFQGDRAHNIIKKVLKNYNTAEELSVPQLNQLIKTPEDYSKKQIIQALKLLSEQLTQVNLEFAESKNQLEQQLTELGRKQELLLQNKSKKRQKRITFEQVHQLMQFISGESFVEARARLAFTILAITDISFKQMHQLQIQQVQTLFQNSETDLLKQRRTDLERLCLIANRIAKKQAISVDTVPIFTAHNLPRKQPINSEHFLKQLNHILLQFSNHIHIQPHFTTHSFRHISEREFRMNMKP